MSFSRAGFDVVLYDSQPGAVDAALRYIEDMLEDLARNRLLNDLAPQAVRSRISSASDLPSAIDGAIHIQESVPELLELKIAIFKDIDAAAGPDAVLASSASAILPSQFTESLKSRDRCIVAHPVNPPHLLLLVELVPAPWTSTETVARTRDLMSKAGQHPIMMKREIEGFILNRLQAALLCEAFRLVGNGIADTTAVDDAVRYGLGLRWSFMGPFETIDLNMAAGIADYIDKGEPLFKALWQTQLHDVSWGGDLRAQVLRERETQLPRSGLVERQKWRDRRLMALAAHKREVDKTVGV